MEIDCEVAVWSPAEAAVLSKKAEDFGFGCFWVNETKHDPFVQLALAASATESILVGSSIALAFTRSPTTIAYTAWDLQNLSNGRLLLGLGSQVKGHIERRFGMKWESPGPKMKEVILALRAVWKSWQEGAKLEFSGKFYRMDLMTPFFSPGPIEHPTIPVYVAGVNPGMCRMVGRYADGLHVHPLHTQRYIREVVRPALEQGAERSGRRAEDISVAASVFAAVGDDRSEIRSVREAYRGQVAFYASTRTYRKLMDLHGWGDVCDRLHEHSVKGEWGKMEAEVTDEILDHFVVEGSWDEMGALLRERYSGLANRVRLYLPFDGDEAWRRLVAGFRA